MFRYCTVFGLSPLGVFTLSVEHGLKVKSQWFCWGVKGAQVAFIVALISSTLLVLVSPFTLTMDRVGLLVS